MTWDVQTIGSWTSVISFAGVIPAFLWRQYVRLKKTLNDSRERFENRFDQLTSGGTSQPVRNDIGFLAMLDLRDSIATLRYTGAVILVMWLVATGFDLVKTLAVVPLLWMIYAMVGLAQRRIRAIEDRLRSMW